MGDQTVQPTNVPVAEELPITMAENCARSWLHML